MTTAPLTRRTVLLGGAGLTAALALAGCTSPTFLSATSAPIQAAERGRRGTGRITDFAITAQRADIDLAGRTASTWAYNGVAPGSVFRATAGDTIRARVTNDLPEQTSIHWHGLALRNDMDGVPMITQEAIPAGGAFDYEFVADTPGTYWFHPHVGVQLDRGLVAPLIIDDPNETTKYDAEWMLVLDDWLDGVTATPDEVLAELKRGVGPMEGGHIGDGGMRMGNTLVGTTSKVLGGEVGDVYYPYYLINGRPKADPETFTAQPGQRIRLRILNAGGDTPFRFWVGGHKLTVTHTDGYPVVPAEADSLIVGMGERYDAIVTVGDGAFPVFAVAEGKADHAFAVLRSSPGAATPSGEKPSGERGVPLDAANLKAAAEVRLSDKSVDRSIDLSLTGDMATWDWGINRKPFDMHHPLDDALSVREGERVRLTINNATNMWHPFHLHGHTSQHAGGGPRKDTSIVLPGRSLSLLFDADNPGLWMAHCHNIYHAEGGMMTVLGYEK